KIGKGSLLYSWEGTEKNLPPVILCAHYDVVPADTDTLPPWTHPPFAGEIADGYIWGRGARDFKPGLMGIMEAAEYLISKGFRPKRTVYFAFGHDEEIQGYNGAGEIAAFLEKNKIRAEFILDEGGGITKGMMPGISPERLVALVNTAEKGYLSLKLTAHGSGGHSAAPGKNNPVLILARALQRLQDNRFSAALESPARDMFETLAPHMSFPASALFGNLRLTKGCVVRIMEKSPDSDAMIRTTMAFTMFNAGTADNVIPPKAEAVVNIRMMPGVSAQDAIAHVKATVDDEKIDIAVHGRFSEAPAVSGTGTDGYRFIAESIKATFGGMLIAPGIAAGTTDIRHYAKISPNLYRFAPSVSTKTFSGNGHKADERLPVENYPDYCEFYTRLLMSAAGR
ncbi:MAG: M20/M25/M40 family metallo-hydrolase, partial [Spirochaetota bacterium]